METLQGINASDGIGIGTAVIVTEPTLTYSSHEVADTAAETDRLHRAIDAFVKHTEKQAELVEQMAGPKEAEILSGHIMMISDPYMAGEMDKLIGAGQCAEDALTQICDTFAQMFEASGDELTMQRATDVRDVKQGVLAALLGCAQVDIATLPEGSIIVTHDLTPSMTAGIRPGAIAGVVTETGGMTSHSAILARAMELPAVLSVPDACTRIADGASLVVDGTTGTVTLDPDEQTLAQAQADRQRYAAEKAELANYRGVATATADGRQVELFANIGKPEDAAAALDNDAEGVGLFRTEFLFMDNDHMPSEEEQFAAYRRAVATMAGRPVIIRTLDIGGDKDIPYMGLEHEDNPFMGYRAVRYCLGRPDVYRTQLRAILRASAIGEVRVMIPLVTCVDEVTQVRAMIKECMAELDAEGTPYDPDIQVGVMIETPAAALMADEFAKVADFFSIGTNDLTGYTMAADRGNEHVRYLYAAYNPAVLRSIRSVIAAGRDAGITVGMCGEAAADPLLIPMWMAFGLDEYSVSPTRVLACRRDIHRWSQDEARALADKVMALATPDEVIEALEAAHKE
jgi:phosphotransferase system enzyme I (PtsI)